MQSLKKKFGKFAISQEQATKVNGGARFRCNTLPECCCPPTTMCNPNQFPEYCGQM